MMTTHSLSSRLVKLEAKRPVEAEPSAFPEPPDTWYAEVICLLWKYGLFSSIEEMVQQTFGLTDHAEVADMVAWVAHIVEETPADAF